MTDTPPPDFEPESEYKRAAKAALTQSQSTNRDNLERAFDTSRRVADRLTALAAIGSISGPEDTLRALELIRNTRVSAEVRAVLLDKVAGPVGKDEGLLELVSSFLRDPAEADVVRAAALRVLQANSFSSPTLLAQRSEYMSTLRALVDDRNPAIRESALEHLAMNQDEYVQRRLVQGLEDPEVALVEPEKAVQLLSYDLHAEHFPLLRRLAEDPPNPKTRMEALRNLGADADSADLLREALADEGEDPEVRHLSGVALKRLDPRGFEVEADRIVATESADPELKVALLNTKLHTPGADQAAVAATIEEVAEAAPGDEATAQAEKLRSIAENKASG